MSVAWQNLGDKPDVVKQLCDGRHPFCKVSSVFCVAGLCIWKNVVYEASLMLRFIYLMHVTIYDMQNIVFYVYLYIYTICNRYIPIVNTVCMCHLLWVGKRWVGELLLGFRNVVLLPSWASFAPHFVYVKAS